MQDRGVMFQEGIPDHQTLVQLFPQGQGVLVLDDLTDEGSNDKRVLDLFTKHSIIKTSRFFTCAKTCFPWVNMPKVFPTMPITSWPSRTRGVNWEYAVCCFNHSHHLERQFGNPSSRHYTSLWVFGVGFASGFVRPATILEPPLKKRGMDAHLSKASPSDKGW